jgi:hypothetical protein
LIFDLQPSAGDASVVVLPPELPLSSEHIESQGVYLLDNGDVLLLRVGQAAPQEFVTNVLEQDQTRTYAPTRSSAACS